MSKPVDFVIAALILRKLTSPFNKWKAFKAGVINAKGEIIVPPKNRTPVQKQSFTALDIIILNMKKLLAKIPGGASRFASYAAALYLLKEHEELDEQDFMKFLVEVDLSDVKQLEEDDGGVPTNNVGSGNIAGTVGDPPVFRKSGKKKNKYPELPILRRPKVNVA